MRKRQPDLSRSGIFPRIENIYREQRKRELMSASDITNYSFRRKIVNLDSIPEHYMTREERVEYRAYIKARLHIVKILARRYFFGKQQVAVLALLHSTHPTLEVQRICGVRLRYAQWLVQYVKTVLLEFIQYYEKRSYKYIRIFLKDTFAEGDLKIMEVYLMLRDTSNTARRLHMPQRTVYNRLKRIDTVLKHLCHVEEIRDFFTLWRRLLKLTPFVIRTRKGMYEKGIFTEGRKRAAKPAC